jgi:signal transduction histidine kinase
MSIRDVTVEEAVDRMKTEFISTVSHELKTPLTSMKGALQFVMTKSAHLNETDRELLSVSLRNTDRLIRLVNDILDISKIEAGRIDFNCRPLSVCTLTRSALEEIRGFAMQKNLAISNEVNESLPLVYGDQDRLMQVLSNLLSNAIKFSPKDGTIIISAWRDGNYVTIAVVDQGKEVEWADREKLFKKFQQFDTEQNGGRDGTGLGLAICKEIIERHHGRIYYQVRDTGGNQFAFTVPVCEEQP